MKSAAEKHPAWKPDKIQVLLELLADAHPEVTTELRWNNPFELLLATILSAQTTDRRVNEVAPSLFSKFPSPEVLAAADPADVERIIQPLGFFRQKTRSIIGAANMIVEEFGGRIPASMEELIRLPGVGRKTAAVVLGTAFDLQEGIFVDTHVRRVSYRLGLTANSDPVKIERDLMDLIPQKEWTRFGHAVVLHGRYVCVARKPKCSECILEPLCPKTGVAGD